MDGQEEWIQKTASWLSCRFRVCPDDAGQELRLWLLKTNGNRKFAKLKAIALCVRDERAWQGAVVERAASPEPSEIEVLAAELLRERDWLIVQLHVQHGMSFAAIGRQLRLSGKRVSVMYQRAIEELRESWER